MWLHEYGAHVYVSCTQGKDTPAKKLPFGSTPTKASQPTTPAGMAPDTRPATDAAAGEAAPKTELQAPGEPPPITEPEVEIPAVEPDWAETLRNDGPGVMMQKLCGFKLSHAEKTPDDPAERCGQNTFNLF